MRLASLCAAVAFSFARPAAAETPPNVWDIAAEPQIRDRWTLHARVTSLRLPSLDMRQRLAEPRRRELERQLARGVLEAAHASSSPDVRLQFDLGEVYEELHRHAAAVSVLKTALASDGDHPAADDAYWSLATAYAQLGATERERDAHEAFLARSIEPDARATALLNLAESDMRAGDLDRSVESYQLAVQQAAKSPFAAETVVLAEWGLAVAHDRRGDSASSYREAKRALENDPGAVFVGADPNVYFVPAYERNWYLALAATVYAREGTDWGHTLGLAMQNHGPAALVPVTGRPAMDGDMPRGAARWGRVEVLWSKYLEGSADDHTRPTWEPRAREHLAAAHREKLRATQRQQKKP